MKKKESISPLWPKTGVLDQRSGGGGGGTLIFSSYVGSGQASTVHPQKISGISSTPTVVERHNSMGTVSLHQTVNML